MRCIVVLILALILSSCSQNLSPFSQKLYDTYNWTEEELAGIQFYLSEDVRLYRDIGKSKSNIMNGSIIIENGREIEELVFKKGTPGVFKFSPKEKRLGISFENSDKMENYLMFGPNARLNGTYALLAKEWNNRRGIVTYNGIEYYTNAENAFAALLIDIKKISKEKYNSKVVGGKRI